MLILAACGRIGFEAPAAAVEAQPTADVDAGARATQLVASEPADGAINVPVDMAVRLTFDSPVDPASLGPVTVLPPVSVRVQASANVVALVPDPAWALEADYALRYGAFNVRFRTYDPTPPKVLGSSPADGANPVSTRTSIRIDFSEPMRPDASDALALVPKVDGTLTWSKDARTLLLQPSAPLQSPVTYRLQVSAAARDRGDNALAAPWDIYFHTGNVAPAVAPVASVAAVGGEILRLRVDASDADEEALRYRWAQTSGPALPLQGSDTPEPYVYLPNVDATYGMRVTVSDRAIDVARDAEVAVVAYSGARLPMAANPLAGGPETWWDDRFDLHAHAVHSGYALTEDSVIDVQSGRRWPVIGDAAALLIAGEWALLGSPSSWTTLSLQGDASGHVNVGTYAGYARAGDVLYLGTSGGFTRISLADPAAPVAAVHGSGDRPSFVAWEQGLLYVQPNDAGVPIAVYDVSGAVPGAPMHFAAEGAGAVTAMTVIDGALLRLHAEHIEWVALDREEGRASVRARLPSAEAVGLQSAGRLLFVQGEAWLRVYGPEDGTLALLAEVPAPGVVGMDVQGSVVWWTDGAAVRTFDFLRLRVAAAADSGYDVALPDARWPLTCQSSQGTCGVEGARVHWRPGAPPAELLLLAGDRSGFVSARVRAP
jgi:hypothetical protein